MKSSPRIESQPLDRVELYATPWVFRIEDMLVDRARMHSFLEGLEVA